MSRAIALPAFLLLATSTPLIAQPAPPPAMLHGNGSAPTEAGTYQVDPDHTQVAFAVSHMGISPYAGWFSQASGTLTIDPAKPESATVSISLPIASIMTTSAKLTDELKSADWFDAAKFPTATFKSNKVTVMGTGARIDGTLTLHGVSRPMTLHARLFGSAVNPMSKKPNIGFIARTLIKRSDFGVSKYVPLISDDVELVINAAFQK